MRYKELKYMKNKLKQITDNTVNELLPKDIILPSNYFQCFDKHAKLVDINLREKEFEKELNELIFKEFNEINNYVNDATKTVKQVANITKDAQIAIENQDSSALKILYKEIKELHSELENITEKIYKDYLTKVYNKKWVYQKYLHEDATFKKDSLLVLIDIKDYEYIAKTYNKMIADNFLIFIIKFIKDKFNEEDFSCEIARYLPNKFLVSLENHGKEIIENFVENVKALIIATTLKSNSGVMIKPSFEYSVLNVQRGNSFHESLDSLLIEVNASDKS
jgi:diguanylate cyclase